MSAETGQRARSGGGFAALQAHRFYKPAVAVLFGWVGFAVNFLPLHIQVPPNQATMVLGLTLPMVVAIAWGWRYALLSLTVGLAGQAMWILWVPINGWAPFVAVPVYNLWVLWHGWAAHAKPPWGKGLYRSELIFRVLDTVILYTVFRWVWHFNPSPWSPGVTLTEAPLSFVHFIAFKQVAEGFIVVLLADILLHLRSVRRLLVLRDESVVNMGAIVASFALFGVAYWFLASLVHVYFLDASRAFHLSHDSASIADALILSVPPDDVFERIILFVTALSGGLLVAKYANQSALRSAELSRSEERYRHIFNAPHDAIFLHDADTGVILDVNQGMMEMYGLTHEEALAATPTDLAAEQEGFGASEARERIRKAVEEGPQTFEWPAKRRDGSMFWVEVALRFVEHSGGRFVIAVVRDIDARKRADAERVRLEEALSQSQKMEAVGTLAGGIAHDFNNILAAILGYTELAKMQAEMDGSALPELDEVIKSSLRARELVEQILTFSRRSEQPVSSIAPQEVVEETVRLLKATIPSSVRFEQEIEPCEGHIVAHAGKVQQVLVNLCTNALQAMDVDSGVMRLQMGCVELHEADVVDLASGRAGRFVRFSVSDTGCGMDEETQRRIFEPYFTTKGPGKGTGLGLSTAHGIVESFEGFFHVESEPDGGSTFHVFFPLIEEGPVEAQPEQPEEDARGEVPGGFERVLFVDDEEAIVSFMSVMLRGLGYEVTASTSPADILTSLQATPEAYDILITDQTMPTITGREVAKRALAIRPDLPVIVCTGYSSTIDADGARALGVARLVRKPLERSRIAQVLRETLDEAQETRAAG